jgi:hypothetical protein
MSTLKNTLPQNVCYTELVYERINKKLNATLSKKQIEELIYGIIAKIDEKYFEKRGKNYYVSSREHDIRITINSSTLRIITIDRI